jgi:hypothetical protein
MYLLCTEIAAIIFLCVNETDLLRVWRSWLRFLADDSRTLLFISKYRMALMHTQIPIKWKVGHISTDKIGTSLKATTKAEIENSWRFSFLSFEVANNQ